MKNQVWDKNEVYSASVHPHTEPAEGNALLVQTASGSEVVGPLTDAELRASPVNVTGPLTDAELRSTAVPVSGPLTDGELRSSPVYTYLTDPANVLRHAEFDNLFQALLMVDIVHHEIHEGDVYKAFHYDEDAASGHVVQMAFTTPATATPQKHVHLITDHEGTGEHQLSLKRGVTITGGGTAFVPTNRHHGSGKTSAVTTPLKGGSKAGNVITYTGGTEFDGDYSGSGKTIGGGTRGTSEWVLAPSTTYIFELFSRAAGIGLSLVVDWYEHTDE